MAARIVATGEGACTSAVVVEMSRICHVAIVDVAGTPAIMTGPDRGLLMCYVSIAFGSLRWEVEPDG